VLSWRSRAALAGGGADTMSATATAAAIKKQELEQGQKTLEQSRQKIEQAVQAQQRQVPTSRKKRIDGAAASR
jgi:hypothetical protein